MQKAKKAKDKLLKRDGDERTDSHYESFYYGGVDPYMWEPQELGKIPTTNDIKKIYKKKNIYIYKMQSNTIWSCIIRCELQLSLSDCNKSSVKIGATRSHLDFFKKQRASRIDHYVIEVNKCIIRLEKVILCLLRSKQVCENRYECFAMHTENAWI